MLSEVWCVCMWHACVCMCMRIVCMCLCVCEHACVCVCCVCVVYVFVCVLCYVCVYMSVGLVVSYIVSVTTHQTVGTQYANTVQNEQKFQSMATVNSNQHNINENVMGSDGIYLQH